MSDVYEQRLEAELENLDDPETNTNCVEDYNNAVEERKQYRDVTKSLRHRKRDRHVHSDPIEFSLDSFDFYNFDDSDESHYDTMTSLVQNDDKTKHLEVIDLKPSDTFKCRVRKHLSPKNKAEEFDSPWRVVIKP